MKNKIHNIDVLEGLSKFGHRKIKYDYKKDKILCK